MRAIVHRSFRSARAVLPYVWGFAAAAALDYVIDIQLIFLPVVAAAIVVAAVPWFFGGDDGDYTRHIHGSPVGYKSPDHGTMLFVQGENDAVQAIGLNDDFTLKWIAAGTEIASQGMKAPGGMPGGMLVLTCQAEGDNTAVLWALMPWFDNANKFVTPGRMVAYGANWVDGSGPNLIKLWDSADWGINYMHAKFKILTPFNNRLYVPSYDGRILVMG
jgi:hypothetical protein